MAKKLKKSVEQFKLWWRKPVTLFQWKTTVKREYKDGKETVTTETHIF